MPKKHLYLHIGTHKTATTTIQAGCVGNRESLLKAGYLYPTTGMYIFGQHNLAWEMANDRPQPWNHVSARVAFHPEWGDLDTALREIEEKAAPNVILSSEDFDGLHADRIAGFRDRLDGFDVDVIVYLREQTSLWQSAWAQFIKSGYVTLGFSQWAEEMLAAPAPVQQFFGRYDLFLKGWADVFGMDCIHVRRYGVDAYGSTIFTDFLRTCGIADPTIYTVPDNQNISPGYPALEISRVLAQSYVSPSVRSRICAHVQEFLTEKGWENQKFHLLTPDLSRHIYGHFAQANLRTARQYLQQDELFPEPRHDRPITAFSLTDVDGTLLTELQEYLDQKRSESLS